MGLSYTISYRDMYERKKLKDWGKSSSIFDKSVKRRTYCAEPSHSGLLPSPAAPGKHLASPPGGEWCLAQPEVNGSYYQELIWKSGFYDLCRVARDNSKPHHWPAGVRVGGDHLLYIIWGDHLEAANLITILHMWGQFETNQSTQAGSTIQRCNPPRSALHWKTRGCAPSQPGQTRRWGLEGFWQKLAAIANIFQIGHHF